MNNVDYEQWCEEQLLHFAHLIITKAHGLCWENADEKL
jgi:hypothetical protein